MNEEKKSTSTILVVDDNPVNIDFLLGLLFAYDVRAALNGESALDQITQEIPDLILLDVAMPGMDGYEVCKIIKSDPKTKNIPVLFLSAHVNVESIKKGFEVGGLDYITKPYDPMEVLSQVELHLELKKVIDDFEKNLQQNPAKQIEHSRNLLKKIARLLSQARFGSFPIDFVDMFKHTGMDFERLSEVSSDQNDADDEKSEAGAVSQALKVFKNFFRK